MADDSLSMKAISSVDVLGAAAFALVSERCRQSYLHDIRGGLQTLNSAVELLIRAAITPGDNAALAEKAGVIARRAVLTHEKSLLELVDDVTPQVETPSLVDVGQLVSDLLRFVANDLASKSISFRLHSSPGLCVRVERHKFRLLMLGLMCCLADELAPGSAVDVTIARSESNALLVFDSAMLCPSIPESGKPSNFSGATSSLWELLVSLTRQWIIANRGGLELSPSALRIHWPLAP
jgi:hypothetical protein